MGWEREGAVEVDITTTSATVDMWLQLLQHSLYVAGEVRRAGAQVTFVQEDENDPFRNKVGFAGGVGVGWGALGGGGGLRWWWRGGISSNTG